MTQTREIISNRLKIGSVVLKHACSHLSSATLRVLTSALHLRSDVDHPGSAPTRTVGNDELLTAYRQPARHC